MDYIVPLGTISFWVAFIFYQVFIDMDIIIFTDVYGNVYLSYIVSLPFATVSHANSDGFPFFWR